MTIDYHITKFNSEILSTDLFGFRIHEVELDIHWVSCGFYVISYPKFKSSSDSTVWIDGMSVSIDPEWIEKVLDIYPTVDKITDRSKGFYPFFQEFCIDRGMIDINEDFQFSAYKSKKDGWIIMHDHQVRFGTPTKSISEWTITFDSLKALNDKLKDHNTEQPMWSGCRVQW